MTKVIQSPSPNFGSEVIPVEFLVLHYTACTLEETLRIFSSPERKVCAHFVVGAGGEIHDLGDFWNGPIRMGAHAGVSSFVLRNQIWESFNRFSIGVEIVNFNGNLIPYSDAQYEALSAITRHLVSRFPTLQDPNRVVGHEQIAGFRGKCDPGRCFDWGRFYSSVYAEKEYPERRPIVDAAILAAFEKENGKIGNLKPEEWPVLSSKFETYLAGVQAALNTQSPGAGGSAT